MRETMGAKDGMLGGLRRAAALLWRHQRLLWWLFAINLALAWISSLPLRAELVRLLNHSLASHRLVTGFDLDTFFLLLERPQMQMRALVPGAAAAAALFLLVTLFFDGGLLLEFVEDRKAPLADFASSCAAYFWRMVRLALYSAVLLGALLAAGAAAAGEALKLTNHLPDARVGFASATVIKVLALLAALFVRQWLDVAQARVVRADGRKLLRELRRSFLPALRSGLYWQYLGIVVLAGASFGAGFYLWGHLPHAAIAANLALLELLTLLQLGARLWMKAASARWVALQPEVAPWSTAAPEAGFEIEGLEPESQESEAKPPLIP